jgi:RNA polymerase sigma-70 factor, ECF subfamily
MWSNHANGNAGKPVRLAFNDCSAENRCAPGQRSAPPPEFSQQIIGEIPFLRRAVRRWHRDAADADDLVQDTLVKALANAHLWRPGSDLRAWLFTIMRHQFLAVTGKSRRAAALLNAYAAADWVSAADSHDSRLVLRDVGAVLRRLPTKQRTALRLAGVEGKCYEEVAAVMGLSVGAVRCHLARARERLRVAVRGSDSSSPCAPRPRHPALPALAQPVRSREFSERAMAMAD